MSESNEVSPPPFIQLRFYRPHLDDLPQLVIPNGYVLRTFQPGDESGWAAVLAASFDDPRWNPERIHQQFIEYPQFQPERVFLVEHEGRIVGTATAWELNDPLEGYVHWVGVLPGHQGKKLGRLVTLATLHQFRREGRRSAVLDTDDFRTAACATYLNLGFLPRLDSPEREAMWAKIRHDLQMP